ncbi:MAG TPA: 2Fe-2S iron-sulfur cluster-binding protein, partial [Acidimicrobiia bacterium]|nr:2Fe-2S iron-sulfur cluster-binding protein [Acidimicrobiia bacterium]
NGDPVDVEVEAGESLLSVLRERLGIVSVKDGCAPQGQCGCCTVLVDGGARVSCVTPATRVAGRHVTTIEGLDAKPRDTLVDALVATGGSQCGFCTPGIVVRLAALLGAGKTDAVDVDRALAAHLCRCTGWQTIVEAFALARGGAAGATGAATRDLDRAARTASLGRSAQVVGPDVVRGAVGFADDTAPRDALVAVPAPDGADVPTTHAAGVRWVVADSLLGARALAGKVQGRRTTRSDGQPLAVPPVPLDGVALATGWLEPAYLELDASWCAPGGDPASALANGGAFGGKEHGLVERAARELADACGRAVRVVLSREDVVRLGPKRPPIAASACLDGEVVRVDGRFVAPADPADRDEWLRFATTAPNPYGLALDATWEAAPVAGPPTSSALRAAGYAETVVLLEGALDAAGVERSARELDAGARAVLLDNAVRWFDGSTVGARVEIDVATGLLSGVSIRAVTHDEYDDVVLRSYLIGAAHMALGWVLTEAIAVDADSGEPLDLTIRSFGIIRARDMPPVDVELVQVDAPPLGSFAPVFAAVAAATWNAVTRAEADRPTTFPARNTRAARPLRR